MNSQITCYVCERPIQRGLIENRMTELDGKTVVKQDCICFLCLDTPFNMGGVELPRTPQSAFLVGQMFATRIRWACSERQMDTDAAIKLVSGEMSAPEDYIRDHLTYYEKHRDNPTGHSDVVKL